MEKMTKIQKVKEHFKRNKGKYITGVICLVVGAGVGVVSSPKVINGSIAGLNLLSNNNNTYVTNLSRRGHAGNIIRCVETGEEFASQNRAAELLNISRTSISNHLKGKQGTAGGLHFEKVGNFNSQE